MKLHPNLTFELIEAARKKIPLAQDKFEDVCADIVLWCCREHAIHDFKTQTFVLGYVLIYCDKFFMVSVKALTPAALQRYLEEKTNERLALFRELSLEEQERRFAERRARETDPLSQKLFDWGRAEQVRAGRVLKRAYEREARGHTVDLSN